MSDGIKHENKKLLSQIKNWFKERIRKKDDFMSGLYYNSPTAIKNTLCEFVYDVYAEALHEKIKPESDAKNTGIIASYGAGKSSLIETYKEKFKLKSEETITSSLANFNDEIESTKKSEPVEVQGIPLAKDKPS